MVLTTGQVRRIEHVNGVRAAVLVFHGGTDNKRRAKRPLRVVPPRPWVNAYRVQRGVADRIGASGIAVWALRHRLAGWDRDDDPTPVQEARAALGVLAKAYRRGGVPVVLVGHSMGARTEIRVADDPSVLGVIGLAPWLPAEESPATLAGKHLRVAYAELDTTCSYDSMRTFLGNARSVTASTAVRSMGRDVHGMLFEPRWHEFTAQEALRMIEARASRR